MQILKILAGVRDVDPEWRMPLLMFFGVLAVIPILAAVFAEIRGSFRHCSYVLGPRIISGKE